MQNTGTYLLLGGRAPRAGVPPVAGEALQAVGEKLEDSLLDPRHQPVAFNKLGLIYIKHLMRICRAQPPVRREGGLKVPAPDGSEDGLQGQIAGQQTGGPLEERQLCLVSLKPGAVQGQVGRAGGELSPGLNQLLCNGLTNNTIYHLHADTQREYITLLNTNTYVTGAHGRGQVAQVVKSGDGGHDVEGWQSRTLNGINILLVTGNCHTTNTRRW